MIWTTTALGGVLVLVGTAVRRNIWGIGGFTWKANRSLSLFTGWMDRLGQDRYCRQQGAVMVVFGVAFILVGARSLL